MSNPPEYTSSRILTLRSENFKRLKAVTITPDGNMVRIVGKNGAGKSSVLDSIASALGGGDCNPADPIRHGAKKARVVLEMEDLTVTRTFTKSGSTLVIEGKDGAPKKSPQDLLNSLTGKVTFDPLLFLALKPKDKLDALRKLVGIDTTAVDAARLKAFNERTMVGREMEQQKALVAKLPPFFGDAPDEEVSSTEVLQKIDQIHAHNQEVQKRSMAVSSAESALRTIEGDLAESTDAVARLKAELAEAEKHVVDGQAAVDAQKKLVEQARGVAKAIQTMDAEPLKTQLSGLESANAKVRANNQRGAAETALKTKQTQYDAFTRKIEECDEKKQALLESTKFPVDGLALGEDGVTFKGVSLEQASDAEKLRVSVAIAAAMNPQLKIMLARNASLLDEDSLKLLAELAEKYGLQIWLEVVSSTDKTGVVIEDGHIAGEEVPEEPAEPEIKGYKPGPVMIDEAPLSSNQPQLELPPS